MSNFNASQLVKVKNLFNQIATETYSLPRENLIGFDLVPRQAGVKEGVLSWTYPIMSELGMAKIVSDYGDDVPSVSRGMEFKTVQIKETATSFAYSIFELQQAIEAGISLNTDLATTARRKIEEHMDRMIQVGEPDSGFYGLLNNPSVPRLCVKKGSNQGSSNVCSLRAKTLAEIIETIQAMIDGIRKNTAGANGGPTIVADTLLLPHKDFVYLATTPKDSNGAGDTLLTYLKTVFASQGLVNWIEVPALTGLGENNTTKPCDRLVLYKKDPSCVTYIAPVLYRQLDPQEDNFKVKVPCYGRFGGVIFKKPNSAIYADECLVSVPVENDQESE